MNNPSPRLLLATSLALALAAPGEAAKRFKLGPIEFLPSLAIELRQHSNVYVTSDQSDPRNNPTVDVSGFIIDIRPGGSISIRPNLEKTIRGLFLEARYTPTVSFFPNAPRVCRPRGTAEPAGLRECPDNDDTPDALKLSHHAFASLRYQMSPQFALSGRVDFSQPELSAENINLEDLTIHGGLKYDLSQRMSLEGGVGYKEFTTPMRIADQPETKSRLGSFDSRLIRGRYELRLDPSLSVGAEYQRHDRDFSEPPAPPFDQKFDVPITRKDLAQQSLGGFASKRLTRTAQGSVRVNWITREAEPRVFGAKTHDLIGYAATFDTLLAKRTRVQTSAEFTLTDTVREITFPDLNAFSNDQTGQFSVLPQQFAVTESQRYLLDVIQNVNVIHEGDQVILGFAYQRDHHLDQLGTRNLFDPEVPRVAVHERLLDGSVCEQGSGRQARFCQTVLDNARERRFLFTAGYRLRVLRWAGLQVRGTYFNGSAIPEITEARRALFPPPAQPAELTTSYWSLNGGLVINLSVLQ